MCTLRNALIVLFIASVANAGTIADLDAKNGFRDLRFGVERNKVSGLILVENGGLDQYYTRASDSKAIGQAELQQIAYAFYKNRLWGVVIKTKGSTNSTALLRALKATYGPGDQPNQFLEKYRWVGSKVLMTYEENQFSGEATVVMISLPLNAWRQDDQKNAAANAASDL